jgi:hypothetical protein
MYLSIVGGRTGNGRLIPPLQDYLKTYQTGNGHLHITIGRPVQWTLCSQSFRARNCISSTHNLPRYYECEGRPHHIGPPQSLCRILPLPYYGIIPKGHTILAFLNHYAAYCLCHIMALYQKGTPYWPSSLIMPHIALPYYGILPKGHTILAFLNHYAPYCLCHIMALYQKGTPYWPSSIIMPHIALVIWHVNWGCLISL